MNFEKITVAGHAIFKIQVSNEDMSKIINGNQKSLRTKIAPNITKGSDLNLYTDLPTGDRMTISGLAAEVIKEEEIESMVITLDVDVGSLTVKDTSNISARYMDFTWYYDQIKNSQIHMIENGKFAKSYLLKKYPDKTSMSTYLIFTPFGTIITGDLRPSDNGVIALSGYSLDWFAEPNMAPDYLAEKFRLKKVWSPEKTKLTFHNYLTEWKEKYSQWLQNGNGDDWDDRKEEPDDPMLQTKTWFVLDTSIEGTIIDALEYLLQHPSCFESWQTLFNALPYYNKLNNHLTFSRHRPYTEDDLLLHYKEEELGWLSAIQLRFSECYRKNEIIDASHA